MIIVCVLAGRFPFLCYTSSAVGTIAIYSPTSISSCESDVSSIFYCSFSLLFMAMGQDRFGNDSDKSNCILSEIYGRFAVECKKKDKLWATQQSVKLLLQTAHMVDIDKQTSVAVQCLLSQVSQFEFLVSNLSKNESV